MPGRPTAPVEQRLREEFSAAGCDGFLHVLRLDTGAEIGLEPDSLVVSASVFKIAVALELFRRGVAGEIDVTERLRLDPRQSLGAPAGLSLFRDEVEASLRDLAVSMLTVSDALATDALLGVLGIDSVNELTRSLGLTETVLTGDLRSMFDNLARDAGFSRWEELAAQPGDPEVFARMRASWTCDPARATRTTPRETTALLRAIWLDEAAPPEACADVRTMMGKQLQRQRIAAGFRVPRIRVSAKTGSFGGAFRNEAAVVEYPDGDRYAVAVFTRGHELYERQADIEHAIGTAAHLAVAELRVA